MTTLLNWTKNSAAVAIFKQLISNKIALFAVIYVVLFYLVGIVMTAEFFGVSIAPYDFREQNYEALRQGSSWSHPFGTDLLGRDQLTRVLYSMRTLVFLTILVMITGGLVLPVGLGLVAGYFGKKWDWTIMRIGEIFDAIPGFFMIIFITVTLRPRYESIVDSLGSGWYFLIREGILDFLLILFVLTIFSWVKGARVIRAQTFTLREMPYVDSARVLGASHARIIMKHILPNLLGIIVLSLFSTLAAVVFLDIAIAFFGLGIRPPHPSFGILFNETANVQILRSSPHMLIFPGVIVILFIMSFFYIEKTLNVIVNAFYSRR